MHGRRTAGIQRKSMQNKELTTYIKQSLHYTEIKERSEHILVGTQGKRVSSGNVLEKRDMREKRGVVWRRNVC